MLGYGIAAAARALGNRPDPIKCNIVLDGNLRKELVPWNQTEITGAIVLEPENSYDLQNMWIQLEGIAISRFFTKVDGITSKHFQSEFILPPSMSYFAVGEGDRSRCQSVKLSPGRHRFPFKLTPDRVTYPTSFKSSYGLIQYRLAVYINNHFPECVNQDYCWERKNLAATIMLSCRGYRNMAGQEDLLMPIEITKSKEKYFTKRLVSKVTMNLDKQGYMCGEVAQFYLFVENPVCDRISVLILELIHKVTYFGSPASAIKTSAVVLRKLVNQVDTCDGEIMWSGEFSIPANLMPSFATTTKCVEISYIVRFSVETNRKVVLKGETAVLIGTTEGACKTRSRISNDNLDTVSVASLPNYSALSSRRSSVETLPPTYDDALRLELGEIPEEEPDAGMRPRSRSNAM